MNIFLKTELFIASFIFFIYILFKVKKKELELKYVLIWLFASIIFILVDLFPQILKDLSIIIHIVEPVNALFLITIISLITITFSLTVALSRITIRVKSLTQEIGILKLESVGKNKVEIKNNIS